MFKIGDKVRCVKDAPQWKSVFHVGSEHVVTSVSPCGGYIRFNGDKFGWRNDYFELIIDMKPEMDLLQLAKEVCGKID